MILDSNIIIYSSDKSNTKLQSYLRINASIISASDITQLEVLGYHNLTPTDKLDFERFFSKIIIYEVSPIVIKRAIELRQQKKMSMGDSIIAATALIYNEPIFTHNEGDFKHIKGLIIIPLSSI